MSRAGAALLRALIDRAGCEGDRILLTEIRSTDWQSLTFVGERHEIRLSVVGEESESIASRLVQGLEEHEFHIPGEIVADISAAASFASERDATLIAIEALTIRE